MASVSSTSQLHQKFQIINETESIINENGFLTDKKGDDSDDDESEKCESGTSDRKTKIGKKTRGRVKIEMKYIENKLRRYTTFSKRKTGIMKKAYELSTLTGTQVMLLVASETGHVYTFATKKLQPMITSETGKALIQTCLNSPDGTQVAADATDLALHRFSPSKSDSTSLTKDDASTDGPLVYNAPLHDSTLTSTSLGGITGTLRVLTGNEIRPMNLHHQGNEVIPKSLLSKNDHALVTNTRYIEPLNSTSQHNTNIAFLQGLLTANDGKVYQAMQGMMFAHHPTNTTVLPADALIMKLSSSPPSGADNLTEDVPWHSLKSQAS